MDLTIFGVFQTKQEAVNYIKKYNRRLDDFQIKNVTLLKAANPNIVYEEFPEAFDKLGNLHVLKNSEDIDKKLNELSEKVDDAVNRLEEVVKEAGIVVMHGDDWSDTKLFEFNERYIDDYITEFANGKPESIAYYEE